MNNASNKTEVLIAGAGPTGLMLACQLALHGIHFRIIDKRRERRMHSGALIVQARTLEILETMGLAKTILKKGIIAKGLQTVFNGKTITRLNISRIGEGFSAFPYLLMVEQHETERLLQHYLAEKGVSIEWGSQLAGFEQSASGVQAIIQKEDNAEEHVQAHFLAGADGPQSTVRKKLGIPFLGKSYLLSLFVLDGRIRGSLPKGELTFAFSNQALAGFFPLKENRWRIDGIFSKQENDHGETDFKTIQSAFRESTKMNIDLMEKEWFSVFRSHQRYAEAYQKGNCFLLGDAAHIHSPVGAQGMNTGMQDAFNLGWKLSLVLKNEASENLLKTYSRERQPVAKNVIQATDNVFRILTGQHPFLRHFRMMVFPLLFRTLFRLIGSNSKVRGYIFKSISETGIHYRKGPLTVSGDPDTFPGNTPRPGDRFPFFYLRESEQPAQVEFGQTKHILLVFYHQELPGETAEFISRNEHLLDTVKIVFSERNRHLFNRLGIRKRAMFLVRPDGYIALRSASSDPARIKPYEEISTIRFVW